MADPVQPPPDHYVRQRWIRPSDVEWAQECNGILTEHGAVQSANLYDRYGAARWRGESLIRLLVDLKMRKRWELCLHVNRVRGGYMWTVEYLGRRP